MLTLDRTDNAKPRYEGITFIIDKIQPLDIENFKNIVSFVYSVKIPQSCLLLYSPTELNRGINFTMNIISQYQLIVKLQIMH